MIGNPEYQSRFEKWNKNIYGIQKNGEFFTPGERSNYVIPVVVHIIHNNGPENITDAQVITAIQHLNQSFANTGSYFSTDGTDVGIQFCLAVRNEAGNFTTGITRTQSPLTNMTVENDDAALKNLITWNQNDYLNIWVVGSITSVSTGSGIGGYAYFPSSHGYAEDGIVIETEYFGTSVDNSKVLAHECGHYLGVYHTFEGGCVNNDCLSDGDHICDTPPDGSTANVFCPSTINTCTTDEDDPSVNNPFRSVALGGAGDQLDMIYNYMDYGLPGCMHAFTVGQADRMVFSLLDSRTSLLTSQGCESVCMSPLTASFNSSQNNIFTGSSVNFTNTSLGAVSYNWMINGVTYSSTQNFTWLFNLAGTYVIQMTASNADPACSKSFYDTIYVTCTANAQFAPVASSYTTGTPSLFTNTSTGGISYNWTIDGAPVSTSFNLSHTFTSNGGYNVCLVANATGCADTLCQFVRVGMCTDKRWNQWVFGQNARIDFNSGLPVSVPGAALNTYEGCASICDNNGNLLFYSDGSKVWNKNNVFMSNGTGLNGTFTTSQSATIIPLPKSDSLFYLFTLDEDQGLTGLKYHVIDISLNAGLGQVIVKNKQLVNPATESLTAMRHCNGIDWWIISHHHLNNNFYSYLLTPYGLDTIPVISAAGLSQAGLNKGLGIMKGSPKGDKLAVSVTYSFALELFDFNSSTGVISNPAIFNSPSNLWPYGVEFSPSGNKLYLCSYPTTASGSSKLYQFNMLAGTNSAVISSANNFYTTTDHLAGLQLAPDGKIYVGEWTMAWTGVAGIDAITNPNATAPACNYVPNHFTLSSGFMWFGMPPNLATIPASLNPQLTGLTSLCNTGQHVTYRYTGNSCGDSLLWNATGGASIVYSNADSVTLAFNTSPFAYNAVLTVQNFRACGTLDDTLVINVKPTPTINIGADINLCGTTSHVFNAGPGFSSYVWNNGVATTQTYTATTPGPYWVKVVNTWGCFNSDTAYILNVNPPVPTVNLGSDTTLCSGLVWVLDAGAGNWTYQWQNNSTAQTYTVYGPGIYYVTVTDVYCNYTAHDTIVVSTWPTPFDLGADTTICEDDILYLYPGPGYLSYEWQDNTTTDSIQITVTGMYQVHVTDSSGCFFADHAFVSVENCSDISEINGNEIFSVYPNPTSGELNIRTLADLRDIEMYISDVFGKVLITNFQMVSAQHYKTNLNAVASGTYLVYIKTQSTQYVSKIIVY